MARWRNITKTLSTKKLAVELKNIANPHNYKRKIVKLKSGYVVKTYR
jgi:hypothetical protein